MKKRAAFQIQPLATAEMTGIGTYTREILGRLPPVDAEWDVEYHAFDFLGRGNADGNICRHLSWSEEIRRQEDVHLYKAFPLGVYIRSPLLQKALPYQSLMRTNADVTVFFNFLYPEASCGKSVITIYDMVSMRFPETMQDRNRRLLENRLAPCASAADHILTISEFSKREIVELLGISPEKISVAPCGIDLTQYYPAEKGAFREFLAGAYSLDAPFFLYLGTLEPRKNLMTLAEAFAVVHREYPELKLVLCGGRGWGDDALLRRVEKLGLSDHVVMTGYIPDEHKRAFYCAAEGFVFPSLYEGFGLPPLEAMACGTPVIVSDNSALAEVVGDAGWKCGAKDIDAFAAAMLAVYEKDYDVGDVRAKGLRRAEFYSWESAADMVGDVIASVVEG